MKSKSTQFEIALRLLEEHREVSTIQLREHGIMSPPQVVSRIRLKGGLINVKRATFIDQKGFIHPRVAVYSLVGWRYE